jgi:signal transduction histidine kinase
LKEKILRFYQNSHFLRSMKTRIFFIIFFVGMIPCIILHYSIVSSYESRAVSVRTSDVKLQMKVLANHLITYGFLEDSESDTINAELAQFSSLNDGRVLVIDDNLKVIKDTYGISEGKTIITEEVVKCRQEGSKAIASTYDKTDGYIECITPIIETTSLESGDYTDSGTQEENVKGVLLTSVSTDSIMATKEVLSRQALLLEIIMLLCVLSLAMVLSQVLVRPFDRLSHSVSEVKAGFLTEIPPENTYLETENIIEAFNRVLARVRSLDDSREEFISNVSHELKTPMASMKVLADSLLSEENVPPEMYREFLTDIDTEIDRENKIIGDLLSLVRMDNRDARLVITNVDIGALTEIICRRVRPLARMRDIEITLVCERSITAEVDELKLTMALTNLIENAVKYNRDHGKVLVTVDADHQNFMIRIEDNGVGMPADSLEHIWERFYRVDKSRSREVGGNGLGLAITKNVVLLHRGTISVSSRQGENSGSTFVLTIPLKNIDNPQESAALGMKGAVPERRRAPNCRNSGAITGKRTPAGKRSAPTPGNSRSRKYVRSRRQSQVPPHHSRRKDSRRQTRRRRRTMNSRLRKKVIASSCSWLRC